MHDSLKRLSAFNSLSKGVLCKLYLLFELYLLFDIDLIACFVVCLFVCLFVCPMLIYHSVGVT